MKAIRLGLLLALAAAAGCGPSTARVSGRVLFKGEPLPGGMVSFRPEDRRVATVSVRLDEQGRYEADLPVGMVRVCVTNLDLKPHEPPPAGTSLIPEAVPAEVREKLQAARPAGAKPGHNAARPPGRYVEIPPRYYNADTSALDFRVEKSGQEHDIPLAP
jgi:hypothetical protein